MILYRHITMTCCTDSLKPLVKNKTLAICNKQNKLSLCLLPVCVSRCCLSPAVQSIVNSMQPTPAECLVCSTLQVKYYCQQRRHSFTCDFSFTNKRPCLFVFANQSLNGFLLGLICVLLVGCPPLALVDHKSLVLWGTFITFKHTVVQR